MLNTKWDYYSVKLPDYSLSAIFNNDYSGLEPADIVTIDDYLKSLPEGYFTLISNESYFSSYSAFNNLGCDVFDAEYNFKV